MLHISGEENVDEKSLEKLGKRGLTLLRITDQQWQEILETRRSGSRFSFNFPHDEAKRGRAQSVVLIAITGTRPGLRVGYIRSIGATATFDSRVVFDLVSSVEPRSLDTLLTEVTERSLLAARTRLASGSDVLQTISSKLGQTLLRKIAAHTDNAVALQRLAAELDRPRRFDNARALQQDAIGLALKAFGLAEASSIALRGDTGLATVRVMEDNVISHDARWLPGWTLSASDVTGRAVFTKRNQQLEVITANKQPLEQLFGVDLIYLNKTRGSLVMVQYKMMEKHGTVADDEDDELDPISAPFDIDHPFAAQTEASDETDDQEWTVGVNKKFRDELARMRAFDQDLSSSGAFRLHPGAFYLKLVKRLSSAESAGIILSLGHFDKLLGDGDLAGNQGGVRISYKKLDGHYLRSEAFVELIRSGYIGTRGATTDNLQTLIDSILKGGRAVVAAIQSATTS